MNSTNNNITTITLTRTSTAASKYLFELTPKSKKKSISLFALDIESLPCTAFLVPSKPNLARSESGRVEAARDIFAGLLD